MMVLLEVPQPKAAKKPDKNPKKAKNAHQVSSYGNSKGSDLCVCSAKTQIKT